MAHHTKPKSSALDINGEDLAELAFGDHLERPAAHLAIGGKPLAFDAGVDDQFKRLPAVRALDIFGDLQRQMARAWLNQRNNSAKNVRMASQERRSAGSL